MKPRPESHARSIGRAQAGTVRKTFPLCDVELDEEQLTRIVEHAGGDLRAALGSIAADQREAVLRRVVLDESYSTIAEQLRCSEQVVRKRVSRGLASLRVNLGEKE